MANPQAGNAGAYAEYPHPASAQPETVCTEDIYVGLGSMNARSNLEWSLQGLTFSLGGDGLPTGLADVGQIKFRKTKLACDSNRPCPWITDYDKTLSQIGAVLMRWGVAQPDEFWQVCVEDTKAHFELKLVARYRTKR